jgi:hypothetical protein
LLAIVLFEIKIYCFMFFLSTTGEVFAGEDASILAQLERGGAEYGFGDPEQLCGRHLRRDNPPGGNSLRHANVTGGPACLASGRQQASDTG